VRGDEFEVPADVPPVTRQGGLAERLDLLRCRGSQDSPGDPDAVLVLSGSDRSD
jgi:hypothetical protein